MRTVLVIPCFNEAARLDQAAFRAFLQEDAHVDFVFANDGSTDDTQRVLEALADEAPERMRVVNLPYNRGKAEAVRQGMLAAFESAPDCVGYWDADLATPFNEIEPMRSALAENPDVLLVMASRVKLLGRDIDRSAIRHYLGRLTATLTSRVLRMPVYDTQCGAKLLRATPIMQSLFDEPFAMQWLVDVEILARMRKALKSDPSPCVIEYPLRRWKDVRGSKVRPTDFFTSIVGLLQIWWRYR
ncbi:MAG: glycosyltransferase [Planctomycetota bacterium]|nr:glycosyltransferase [Planctomycetota bacterium]